MTPIRMAYGEALKELGSLDSRVVVLEADVGGSSKSQIFGQSFPERYFNVGIAENNMTAMAAGFASYGMIPFVNSFASFIVSRAGDAIQSLGAYDHLNVKYCGAYCGLSDAYDGASHHSLSDIAFMRALPGMVVICPCDPAETRKAVFAAAEYKGPVFLRLNREPAPDLYTKDMHFEIGRAITVREGKDVSILATGIQVHCALKAAQSLAKKGISARVLDMHTIQPLDTEAVLACACETRGIVTAEEHSVRGGLGSAVAECLCQTHPTKVYRVGLRDFAESGAYAALQRKYQVDDTAIERACCALLEP